MAEQPPSSSSSKGQVFVSGMISDTSDNFTPEGAWTRARNASKVTPKGDLNTLSNEPANLACVTLPYTAIGFIYLYSDVWAVFTTDNVRSEIGIFDDNLCTYSAIKNDQGLPMDPNNCLGFSTKHLIKGVAKFNFDCTFSVYFADGNMPDRMVNLDKPQFVKNCVTVNNCITCTDTTQIDCQNILLASLVDSPCMKVAKSRSGGSLPNGSYFVTLAYTVNQQKVTDYFPISNVQSLFSHANLGGSLDITFTGLDITHFEEFELVVIRDINQQVSAKRIGIYSTHTSEIFLDNISEELPTVPIELIPIRTPVYEKSQAIYGVGDYALRVAPSTKFDFNYQPLANRIHAKWISVEYPADYYRRGGNITSYQSDEIYPFFLRWIYTTGDRSSSYHIPGRPPQPGELNPNNTIDSISPGNEREFEVNNTATVTGFPGTVLPDGGVVIAEGEMAYWESTEIYPDNKPEIWNSSVHPWSNIAGGVDLCGQPIRHHKFPDRTKNSSLAHTNAGATKIRILGIKFDNIRPPVDNNGVPIPGIVGYEILRGSREGNKTVIARGILNNMRGYTTVNGTPGLYQNYPYNYLGADSTLRTQESNGGWSIGGQPGSDLTDVKKDVFTFHSPDTQFRHPFLAVNELKLYGESVAQIEGNFEDVPGHPKEKLLTDLAFILAALVGVGEAMLASRGLRTRRRKGPYVMNTGEYEKVAKQNAIGGNSGSGSWVTGTGNYSQTANSGGDRAAYEHAAPNDNAPSGMGDGTAAKGVVDAAMAAVYDPSSGSDPGAFSFGTLLQLVLGQPDPGDVAAYTSLRATPITPGVLYYSEDLDTEIPKFDYIPQSLRVLNGVQLISNYWTVGTDTALRLIEAIVPYVQYAYRYRSHGFYSNTVVGTSVAGNRRFLLPDTTAPQYLDTHRQTYAGAEINNLYRAQAVVLKTNRNVTNPATLDNSLVTIANSPGGYSNPKIPFIRQGCSHYAAIIQRFRNQYGQLDSIKQLPVSCVFSITSLTSDYKTTELFGGDIYITRYSEKNTFFYFYDWLLNQPDGYEFDYRTRYMITYPRYWANFTRYDAGEFLQGITSLTLATPSDKAALDGNTAAQTFLTTPLGIRFRIKDAYFYLFQSGVRDFFVESEVNTEQRDWGEDLSERHYDAYNYSDTYSLFKPEIIKSANYFKYDYSLSVSRQFQNFISWGTLQPRYYDPNVAETCYVFREFRVLYSLPQPEENTKDYWRLYLANNYKDFDSKVTEMKSFNQNGAIILFQTASPLLWKGVDELQTALGTKLTVGDGGLFSQPEQSITNVDDSYEYGSCQDSYSVINTPFGLYYMCANQGKIFKVSGGLEDITYHGLKFWFKEYLPFQLLQTFPNYDILDNPVAGIGCQAVYDNQIETIYFSKRDFKLKNQYIGQTIYNPATGLFVYTDPLSGIKTKVSLGDPVYFDDASWTVSYDPKAEKGGWISYHDWHPELCIPSKNNFLTTKVDPLTNLETIWRHNHRKDLFCNYYNKDYPFELEYVASTQTSVNTLRSIEYYMECFRYDPDRLDRFHILDFNFDLGIIHNTEQVSGILNLVLSPKNDPFAKLSFPQLTLQPAFNVLYSKEEQKYRINTFFDITDDRGEFTNAQRMIWITDPNGYTRSLNPVNLNYNKPQTQRKKFRHVTNKISLTRQVSGNVNMLMRAVIAKELLSLR